MCLCRQKKKKYLGKRERSAKIIERGGVERFATGDDIVQKGHAQNINNPDVPIKPRNIIYTPKKINQSMAGQGANISPTDLDFKIDVAENKMKDIKKSNMSKAKKKTELGKVDTKLMKYVAQSDGYKTVTLSDGQVYGEIFQKPKSMDMFDEFPNMTEKETKKFVNKYFTDEGKLKNKWTKGNVSNVDKANIKKSYTFLENIKNAKTNVKQIGASFQEIVNNSKRGGALLTNDILSKSEKYKNVKICKTKFANGGGGLCGKSFAKKYPQEFLQEVMKDSRMANYLKSKESLTAGRSILNNVAKVGRWGNPLTLVGGEAWYSTLAGINEFGKGKSLGEAINEGLWFIPGKHSRDLDMLLGSKAKAKKGRNLPIIPNEVRSQFDMLTQLGDLINKEGALSGQLQMQKWYEADKQNESDRLLHASRFDFPTYKKNIPAQNRKDFFQDMDADINWSKNVITPQIEERLKNVMTTGEDVVKKFQTADPTGSSYSKLQDRIKSKIVDEFNKGKTWDQADPYSGPIWNWIKTREKIPFTNPELVAKQKKLDLLKEGPNQTITKENIPPELIENFLYKFPQYKGLGIFEGASGGRAGYMGGGIAAIRKPSAIPPERQGLRSILINGKKS